MKLKKIKFFINGFFFLSNFYPSPIRIGEFTAPTVEHAYQICKYIKFSGFKLTKLDFEDLCRMLPSAIKEFGKSYCICEEEALYSMRSLLHAKFKDTFLRNSLLSTGSSELIEGSLWGDFFWGVDLRSGIGKNYLGKLLMSERHQINRGFL